MRILSFLLIFAIGLYSSNLKRTKIMMGTLISIELQKKDIKYVDNLFKCFRDVELSLSSYDKNAQIYKLNHNKKAFISSYTYEALSLSKKYYKQTNKYFDISIGSITKGLYHFGEDELIPTSSELKKANINFNGIDFNKSYAYIDKDVVVDLGGMGKGFAVDKVSQKAKTYNIDDAIILASGDIKCFKTCKIEIKNPFRDGVIASLYTTHRFSAISTSGDYERYVLSKKYNHLINPKKKISQKTFASITLVSSVLSNSDLDAFATASSVMEFSEAIEFLNSQELWYLVITKDKKIYMKKGLKFIKDFRFSDQSLKINKIL